MRSKVDQRLYELHATGIIIPRRVGQNVYYGLSDPQVVAACDAMRDVLLRYLEAGAKAVGDKFVAHHDQVFGLVITRITI